LNIPWQRKASPFNPPFSVQENLVCPPVGNIKVEDLIALAMSRRPELQVLDHQIDIAERQVKIDKAALVPRVDAYVSDQALRDQSVNSFDQSVNSYAVGLLGSWNIFDGFASKGATMSDTATLGTAHISRDQMGLQVQSEVREAFARLLTAQQTVQAQAATVKTAEQSVGLAQLSADTGYATLLDVLQATLDLTDARIQEIQTKQQYLDALADLEKAISLKFVDWKKDGVISDSPSTPPTIVPSPLATPPAATH
jgi:OMF family outer membrane factor